ncbi:hypothetical protein C2845_PM14G03160 [Panicum miliaceum]|uniref:Uncharacterized protein n=1 Tax=Panicum miliaceum TaxID=4540 RepID=A0A3L6PTB7_PANMI|nr:hypothetical protein C2845_PM14G03160 [Panicum miliaceum]
MVGHEEDVALHAAGHTPEQHAQQVPPCRRSASGPKLSDPPASTCPGPMWRRVGSRARPDPASPAQDPMPPCLTRRARGWGRDPEQHGDGHKEEPCGDKQASSGQK